VVAVNLNPLTTFGLTCILHENPTSFLPKGTSRNSNGLIIWDYITILANALDMEAMRKELPSFKEHIVIAIFLGARAPTVRYDFWICDLENRISARIVLLRDARESFYFIKLHTFELVK